MFLRYLQEVASTKNFKVTYLLLYLLILLMCFWQNCVFGKPMILSNSNSKIKSILQSSVSGVPSKQDRNFVSLFYIPPADLQTDSEIENVII